MSTKVLLDANMLVSQHFLKGHLGSALVFALRQMHGALVLPEVTAKEARHHAVRLAADRKQAIATATDQLQVILGRRPNVEWPGEDAIVQAIDDHLIAIADVVEQPGMDLQLVRAAVARALERRPPCHNREEFRDALLWEVGASLAENHMVHLVTDDNDFLVAQGSTRVLHPDLLRELSDKHLQLQHHLSLSALLDAMGPQARQPDATLLAKTVGASLWPQVQQDLSRRGITLQQQLQAKTKAFATADPNKLAISFEVPYQASATSISSSSPGAATVNAFGSASLDPRGNTLLNVELDRIDVQYADGGSGSIEHIRSADSSSGSWRTYDFRHPL